YLFFLLRYDPHRHLPSFPTRRSSDLILSSLALLARLTARLEGAAAHHVMRLVLASLTLNLARYVLLLLGGEGFIHEASPPQKREDRKSTRLNSSHVKISYAVFCLQKK